MTLNIAVVGARGSGKTLFCINWCEHLGATRLYYYESGGAGKGVGIVTPKTARSKMVFNGYHRRTAHTFVVNRPGKFLSRLTLTDTFCLQEKPALGTTERTKLFLTLQALSRADLILNLVDLSCSDPSRAEFAAEVDRYLFEFSSRYPVHYKLVGNKLDLVNGPAMIPWWPTSSPVTGVSALKGTGFDLLTKQIAYIWELISGTEKNPKTVLSNC